MREPDGFRSFVEQEHPGAYVRRVLLRTYLAGRERRWTGEVPTEALRWFDDQTEAATADLLGCSVGTVKTHASRALAALRSHPALASLHALEGLS